MTQRELFTTVKNIINGMEVVDCEFTREEIIEGLDARLAALDRKTSSGERKPTKTQVENKGIYANILAIMADGAARTNKAITDIYNTTYGTDFSTNKIQAQVTKAVKGGALDRAVVKGVVYFTIKGDATPTDDDLVEE